MKKNNRGFFLVEAIVIIALVTIIMAYVYPNVAKLYENYENRAKYYDQTEDLFLLRTIYNLNKDTIDRYTCSDTSKCDTTFSINSNDNTLGNKDDVNLSNGNVTSEINSKMTNLSNYEVSALYITNYMSELSSPDYSPDYNFNKYLKRLKKTTYDKASYRIIGIFEKKDIAGNVIETRYASIKIDNPNPNRSTNLGE